MPKKENVDLEKELERISRKSNINMMKFEKSFENRLKKLDDDIDKVMNDKLKIFDDNKKITLDYLNMEFKDDGTINRYREKLKKI
ncbi:MAG: hypothetical protein E7Z77_05485 [Methanobrevibacter sp.]|uniref:hypothetical protein n=1 Tax=Methanobrevibacter sp. TaxID=66852 RepID=UPI0025E734DE|nr:hypothetical protein [Methanobrevibacter sp.]MBE6508852.1 hypothetical protein [Methanobrevibacter sp.]